MRFEDFDVLLFPGAGDNAAHVPCKEFRVQCAVVRDSRGSELLTHTSSSGYELTVEADFTPLLTGFIPSLAPGSQFQISIHSWTPQRFRFHPEVAPNADSPQQVWHVQLTVDGVIIGIEIFQPDVVWPKVISLANTQVIRGRIQPLRFPQFHEEVMKESSWDALSDLGRIKVEISEGYLRGARGNQSFVKLTTHAIFSFQHAPMGKPFHISDVIPTKRVKTFRRYTARSQHRLAESRHDAKSDFSTGDAPSYATSEYFRRTPSEAQHEHQ